jgi:hypothetical protein
MPIADLPQSALARIKGCDPFRIPVGRKTLPTEGHSPMLTFRPITCRPVTLWTKFIGVAIITLFVTSPVWGQPRGVKPGEEMNLAPAITPNIYQATADKKDGKVVIQVFASEILLTKKDPDDKDAKGWIIAWTKMDPLILGEQIRAYKPSGEKIDENTLLKALAKPVAVACFQRTHEDDPEQPDPFYAGAFRDDLVMLVFEAKYWLR